MSDRDMSMTLDEVLESINLDAMLTHELIWNPDSPEHPKIEEAPTPFLLVERTKDFEWSEYHRENDQKERSLCKCGANMHRWSDIIEKQALERDKPCWKCGGSWEDTYGEAGE